MLYTKQAWWLIIMPGRKEGRFDYSHKRSCRAGFPRYSICREALENVFAASLQAPVSREPRSRSVETIFFRSVAYIHVNMFDRTCDITIYDMCGHKNEWWKRDRDRENRPTKIANEVKIRCLIIKLNFGEPTLIFCWYINETCWTKFQQL